MAKAGGFVEVTTEDWSRWRNAVASRTNHGNMGVQSFTLNRASNGADPGHSVWDCGSLGHLCHWNLLLLGAGFRLAKLVRAHCPRQAGAASRTKNC